MSQDLRSDTGFESGSCAPPLAPVTGFPGIFTTLDTLRDEILATVTQALIQSPAGQGGFRDTSRSDRSRSRRRWRCHQSSSISSSSSSGATFSSVFPVEDLEPTQNELVEPQVIECSDDRFAQDLDHRTYRLRNKKLTYGTRDARKMGRVNFNIKKVFSCVP